MIFISTTFQTRNGTTQWITNFCSYFTYIFTFVGNCVNKLFKGWTISSCPITVMDRQISTYRKLHVSQSLPSHSKQKLAILLMICVRICRHDLASPKIAHFVGFVSAEHSRPSSEAQTSLLGFFIFINNCSPLHVRLHNHKKRYYLSKHDRIWSLPELQYSHPPGEPLLPSCALSLASMYCI